MAVRSKKQRALHAGLKPRHPKARMEETEMPARTTALVALSFASLLAVPASSAVAAPRGNYDRVERRLENRERHVEHRDRQIERRDRRVERHDGPRADRLDKRLDRRDRELDQRALRLDRRERRLERHEQ
jgi:hypothetical protein